MIIMILAVLLGLEFPIVHILSRSEYQGQWTSRSSAAPADRAVTDKALAQETGSCLLIHLNVKCDLKLADVTDQQPYSSILKGSLSKPVVLSGVRTGQHNPKTWS
ncbi:hypothetical protein [Hahella ganghwensis]|uniref:hypothetical protein n=1 Tax=Hahella ganghwensis TaxID=286420 RepID=UPI00037ED9EB|nr:hypothetical protein [Hahella ganghwensis]